VAAVYAAGCRFMLEIGPGYVGFDRDESSQSDQQGALMTQPVPRLLLVALAVLGGLSLTVGVVLEVRCLGILQRHPYLVNTLSGVTGFAASGLVAGVIVGRLAESERQRGLQSVVAEITMSVLRSLTRTAYNLAVQYGGPDPEPIRRGGIIDIKALGEPLPDNPRVREITDWQWTGIGGLQSIESHMSERARLAEAVWARLAELPEQADLTVVELDQVRRLHDEVTALTTSRARYGRHRDSIAQELDYLADVLLARLVDFVVDPEIARVAYDVEDEKENWRALAFEVTENIDRRPAQPAVADVLAAVLEQGAAISPKRRRVLAEQSTRLLAAYVDELRAVQDLSTALVQLWRGLGVNTPQ
jgi:hypothetical protein